MVLQVILSPLCTLHWFKFILIVVVILISRFTLNPCTLWTLICTIFRVYWCLFKILSCTKHNIAAMQILVKDLSSRGSQWNIIVCVSGFWWNNDEAQSVYELGFIAVDQLALLICSSFYFSLIFFLHSPAPFFFKSIAGIMYIVSHAVN